MWLAFVVLGLARPVLVVQVDAADLIAAVKFSIVKEHFRNAAFTAGDLEVFLACEPDGRWIEFGDDVYRRLCQGELPSQVRKILAHNQVFDHTLVMDHFGEEPPRRSLHLLVRVKPPVTWQPPAIGPVIPQPGSHGVEVYGSFSTSDTGEGVNVNNSKEALRRSTKTRQVIDQLNEHHVLMVTSPPMTGKTSLAALVCQDLESQSQGQRVIIAAFSMVWIRGDQKLFEAFEKVWKSSWKDLENKVHDDGYTLYLILDETQIVYQTKDSSPCKKASPLWLLVKEVKTRPQLNIRISLFAPYGSRVQYADLSTPVEISEHQELGIELLNFTGEELHEYVAMCFEGYASLKDEMGLFCELLKELTGGHVGLSVTTIRELNHVHRSRTCRGVLPPAADEWLQMLETGALDGEEGKLFRKLEDTRAIYVLKGNWDKARVSLERLQHGVCRAEDEPILDRCVQSGILIPTGSSFTFSSPVMWRSFVKKCTCSVQRALDAPHSLKEFMLRVVRAINYDAIKSTLSQNLKTGIPLERAWQMEFYMAVYRSTPLGYETSVDVGALYASRGFLDFTVKGESNFWGIDLLCENDRLDERLARFEVGGRYARPLAKLTDYCLLNFQRVATTDTNPEQLTSEPHLSRVFTVYYDKDFKSVALLHLGAVCTSFNRDE